MSNSKIMRNINTPSLAVAAGIGEDIFRTPQEIFWIFSGLWGVYYLYLMISVYCDICYEQFWWKLHMILHHLNQGYIDDPLPQKVDCDLSESFSRKEKYWQVHRGVNNLQMWKIFLQYISKKNFLVGSARFVDCIATTMVSFRGAFMFTKKMGRKVCNCMAMHFLIWIITVIEY